MKFTIIELVYSKTGFYRDFGVLTLLVVVIIHKGIKAFLFFPLSER
jgi:hypothetical protein